MKLIKLITRKPVYIVLVIFLGLMLTYFNAEPSTEQIEYMDISDGKLHVFYLDVGQGDSIFIKLPKGETMLIDAGEEEYGEKVAETLRNFNTSKIDYLIATHPHTDHIGGMEHIVNNFEIGKIYMTNAVTTTATFEDLLDTIKSKGLTIERAKSGVEILSDENLNAHFVAPVAESYKELNDYSAVIKLTYGENSFVFTGDAEKKAEDLIRENIKCDVLKIGHHGSSSSSTKNFLKKTEPKYAVISCGADNEYGHPHKQTLNRLNNSEVNIFRTDLQGTIEAISDGYEITFKTQY